MSKNINIQKYYSNIYNSQMILIGINHSISENLLYNKLSEVQPKCICYELGLMDNIESSKCSEHKAIMRYKNEYSIPVKNADIEDLSSLDVPKDGIIDIDSEAPQNIKSNLKGKSINHRTKIETQYPEEFEFFVLLRDMKMTQKLRESLKDYDKVALVVGFAHIVGIKNRMKKIEKL